MADESNQQATKDDGASESTEQVISLVFQCGGEPVTIAAKWPAVQFISEDEGYCVGCGVNHSGIYAYIKCPRCGEDHKLDLGPDQETM